jgi:hypothetical protein
MLTIRSAVLVTGHTGRLDRADAGCGWGTHRRCEGARGRQCGPTPVGPGKSRGRLGGVTSREQPLLAVRCVVYALD